MPSLAMLKCESYLLKMLSRLVGILEQIDGWIDEIPLRVDPQRFGNLAFRDWGNKLEEVCPYSYFLSRELYL